jgi:hypothetical protein
MVRIFIEHFWPFFLLCFVLSTSIAGSTYLNLRTIERAKAERKQSGRKLFDEDAAGVLIYLPLGAVIIVLAYAAWTS